VQRWPDLRLKAQVGRAFRVPTFNDRYWEPGGNPDLQPERSWGGDLGLWLDSPRGHVEWTAFGHLRRDQIVWRPSGEGHWTPINVGRVRALGSEISGAWGRSLAPDATLSVGFIYTFTDARNRSEPHSASYNEPVRYVPRDQLKAHSTVSWGPATLTAKVRYTGRRPLTSDGRLVLDAYVTGGTRLQLEHSFSGIRTALSVDVENVFNTDYRSIGNRPMPPRHARIRLLVAP
jgi:iron complex outermembrane receptor protein